MLLYHAVPLLQVQCTPDHWLPSLVSLLYFIFGLLLLLSGDVELNPGPVTGIYTFNATFIITLIILPVGNPKDVLRSHSDRLTRIIANNLQTVTNGLYAKDLIPEQTKLEMSVLAIDNYTKASNLVNVIEGQLDSSLNQDKYLLDVCHVLIDQKHQPLTDLAVSMLEETGECSHY